MKAAGSFEAQCASSHPCDILKVIHRLRVGRMPSNTDKASRQVEATIYTKFCKIKPNNEFGDFKDRTVSRGSEKNRTLLTSFADLSVVGLSGCYDLYAMFSIFQTLPSREAKNERGGGQIQRSQNLRHGSTKQRQ